jgi:5-formyltetrahydrofolate cyclo-ligase
VERQRPKQCETCPQWDAVERGGGECHSSPVRKSALRRAIHGSLAAMTPEVRLTKSQLIVRHVLELEEFKRARVVMAYVSMEMEVRPWALLRAAWAQGKIVALPRVEPPLEAPEILAVHDRRIVAYELRERQVDDPQDHDGLEANVMSILEPKGGAQEVPMAEIGLVVVPCVAYDRQGFRLGKGGGFYDRYLSHADLKAATVVLAFSEQVFSQLPHCPHDHPVQILVTEAGVIDMRRKA